MANILRERPFILSLIAIFIALLGLIYSISITHGSLIYQTKMLFGSNNRNVYFLPGQEDSVTYNLPRVYIFVIDHSGSVMNYLDVPRWYENEFTELINDIDSSFKTKTRLNIISSLEKIVRNNITINQFELSKFKLSYYLWHIQSDSDQFCLWMLGNSGIRKIPAEEEQHYVRTNLHNVTMAMDTVLKMDIASGADLTNFEDLFRRLNEIQEKGKQCMLIMLSDMKHEWGIDNHGTKRTCEEETKQLMSRIMNLSNHKIFSNILVMHYLTKAEKPSSQIIDVNELMRDIFPSDKFRTISIDKENNELLRNPVYIDTTIQFSYSNNAFEDTVCIVLSEGEYLISLEYPENDKYSEDNGSFGYNILKGNLKRNNVSTGRRIDSEYTENISIQKEDQLLINYSGRFDKNQRMPFIVIKSSHLGRPVYKYKVEFIKEKYNAFVAIMGILLLVLALADLVLIGINVYQHCSER